MEGRNHMAEELHTDKEALRIIRDMPFENFVFVYRKDDKDKNFTTLMKQMGYTKNDVVSKILKQLTEENVVKANQPAKNHFRSHGECTKVWVFNKTVTIVGINDVKAYDIYIKLIIDTKTNKIEVLSFHDRKENH